MNYRPIRPRPQPSARDVEKSTAEKAAARRAVKKIVEKRKRIGLYAVCIVTIAAMLYLLAHQ